MGELEIASSLRVKGDLLLDGTLWLANTQGIALRGIASRGIAPIASESGSASAASATSQARSALPSGAILLWSGEQLPSGYVKCNGNLNTPNIRAPHNPNGPELMYIIKV
ncbi:hypothetical protein HQQ94_09515 [Shewanella sp. VB17]|uniref:hypothetical protein n=1 Tax=Shewanella sp. VB17 TaxID=2739432 RepID=UPI001566A174|nr:hypothetical protein [Shewanella sp. VB17]NRD73478.1 hypothetical protein [Shewanella sp. VB17]